MALLPRGGLVFLLPAAGHRRSSSRRENRPPGTGRVSKQNEAQGSVPAGRGRETRGGLSPSWIPGLLASLKGERPGQARESGARQLVALPGGCVSWMWPLQPLPPAFPGRQPPPAGRIPARCCLALLGALPKDGLRSAPRQSPQGGHELPSPHVAPSPAPPAPPERGPRQLPN